MLKPETALDSWREWDIGLNTRPVLVNPLGGGRSNRSFMLESGDKKMVLRINAPPTTLPNPDRTVEARVWRAASEAGIAPPLLYADATGEFLVSTFIENSLQRNPASDGRLTYKALELLQASHRLEVDVPEINYAAHIDAYWKIIKDRELVIDPALLTQRDPMQLALKELIYNDTATALCHHDPVRENFVGNPEKMYLIDWEYAARGLRVMDYAAFAVEWGIEAALICARTGIESEFLTTAMDFYRYQCHLWEAITQASRCS